jgi:16S rRNA processing protein RimM
LEGRLLAGQIGKPHGVGGEVYVVKISDDPRRFEPGAELHHEDGRVLTVESARPHRDRFLVKFTGIDDRESAQRARGALYIDSDDRRTLEQDEYWPDDLIGCNVLDTQGSLLGVVTDVTSNAAQDLLIVDGKNYVPMVAALVVSVDVGSKAIVIDPPEGLFP